MYFLKSDTVSLLSLFARAKPSRGGVPHLSLICTQSAVRRSPADGDVGKGHVHLMGQPTERIP
ncbi:hypothetical protein IP83_04575 [Novosphingobium sp. AAP93]|nr:hypothetical protein IP83_04575 [Novosphingobium sp. AAP93]